MAAVGGLWRSLGFADPDPNEPTVSDDDIAAAITLLATVRGGALDRIAAGGGRVVKLIGDAVLFHTPDSEAGARIAIDLVHRINADPHGSRRGRRVHDRAPRLIESAHPTSRR